MLKQACFFLGLGMLFTHELDAMPNHEWRVLPLLRALPDETGMTVFVLAHIPLFALVVALVASDVPRTRRLARLGVGAFLVMHGVLHALYMSHPAYEFASAMSGFLIFGGAALGLAYLLLEARDHRAT